MQQQTVWEDFDPDQLTRMINQAYAGDEKAAEALLPMVYQELKIIAASQRRRQDKPSDMLNTTAVVNEAWIRLHQHHQHYKNRTHFLAVAATAMRQLLVDEARKRLTRKRGDGAVQVTLKDQRSVVDQAEWLVTLDQALEQLGDYKPRLKDIFQLRFFGGLTEQETADMLDLSTPTIRRDWRKAKAMLAKAF